MIKDNIEKVKSADNINLTIIRPNDNNEIEIDLFRVLQYLKKSLPLLCVLIICVSAIILGIGAQIRKFVYIGDASALIEYSITDEETTVDITRVQSPYVIGAALEELELSGDSLDTVRKNIKVTNVMSNAEYDKATLYNNLLSKNNATPELAESLLSISSQSTKYIVSLNYKAAGYDRDTGIALLNAILRNYQQYFEKTYNANATLGNSVSVVDYTNYDYAEAVEVFTDILDDIRDFLEEEEEKSISEFRSVATGYTLHDLLQAEELLRATDLNKISSFIAVNSITAKDPSTEVAHYEFLIENLEREKGVLDSRMDSLSASINAYQKDPVVYTGTEAEEKKENVSVAALESEELILDAYDAMVMEKVATQEQISDYNKTIHYYQSIVERLKKTDRVIESNAEKADTYLADFSQKVTSLLSAVNTTLEEYYSKAVKENTVLILVPATARGTKITDGSWPKVLLVVIAILIIAFIAHAFSQAALVDKAAPLHSKSGAVSG